MDAVTIHAATDATTETRTHDSQNRLTGGVGAYSPTYDAAGNMTGDEAGRTLVDDAWGMIVSVSDASDNVLVAYGYDALNRRIVVTTDPGEVSQTVQIRYYSADWQVLGDVDAGDWDFNALGRRQTGRFTNVVSWMDQPRNDHWCVKA